MDIGELIGPGQVISLRVSSKSELLRELARRAAKSLGTELSTVFDAVMAREALGSTGVGNGVAIPHARIDGLAHFYTLFARLEKPIDFEAVDGLPVDLACLLLVPSGAEKQHLTALACVSRRLRDRDTARQLRAASDKQQLYELLVSVGPPGAAPADRA